MLGNSPICLSTEVQIARDKIRICKIIIYKPIMENTIPLPEQVEVEFNPATFYNPLTSTLPIIFVLHHLRSSDIHHFPVFDPRTILFNQSAWRNKSCIPKLFLMFRCIPSMQLVVVGWTLLAVVNGLLCGRKECTTCSLATNIIPHWEGSDEVLNSRVLTIEGWFAILPV